jgi:hypothetical protein
MTKYKVKAKCLRVVWIYDSIEEENGRMKNNEIRGARKYLESSGVSGNIRCNWHAGLSASDG